MRKVFAWQRKRARSLCIVDGKTLGVAFVQRFGSLLQMNIHGHSIVPDGVYVDDGEGGLVFRPLPPPTDEDVLWVTRTIAKAVIKLVQNWEPFEDDDETGALWHEASPSMPRIPRPADKPGEEPPPAGRRRAQVKTSLGTFSVHADTSAAADDRAGLERMLRYAQRPAFAQKRLSLLPSGQVRYRLRRAYYTGQREVVLEPVAFLRRLAQLIPPPRQNQIRFYGLLASQAHDRPKLETLLPSASATAKAASASEPESEDSADMRERTKVYRIGWAKLLARIFERDVKTCPHCGGERTIRAWVTKRASIERLLGHWDLSADLPITEPARAPPQTELFSSA